MTIRHAALAAAAALVLGLTVYLFVQVRATPASAGSPVPPVAQRAAPEIDEEIDEPPHAPPKAPPPSPSQVKIPQPVAVLATPDGVPGEPPPKSIGDIVRSGTDNKVPQGMLADPKLMAVMDEANKAYDRGDIDEARVMAQKVLAQAPGNARMLRIVVSGACIAGDAADAQRAYLQLPPADREQMKVRCARYGMTFKDE